MHVPARRRPAPSTAQPNPTASASSAGLRYTTDSGPGLRRVGPAKAFRYVDAQGRPVKDRETLARIRSLAIPPAWTRVWISPSPRGHVQATGRDQKGRKQYRYHARWRSTRDQTKFARMVAFARALPRIRAQVEERLREPGLSRDKVLALVVRLLELTLIRVGNEEYSRSNGSFGLTTLRDRHVRVERGRAAFRFRGKGGKEHAVELVDPRVARLVKKCQDLPGQELFQYRDEDGVVRDVSSGDVNDYLRAISGEEFTAKDYRTWAATVLAAWMLQEVEPFQTAKQARRNVVRAIERVAERLGNTPAICRRCYVHPAVIDSYMEGSLLETLKHRVERELRRMPDLPREEALVVSLLTRRLKQESNALSRRGRAGQARPRTAA